MDMFIVAVSDTLLVAVPTFLLCNLLLTRRHKGFFSYFMILLLIIATAYISLINGWLPIFKTIIILGGILYFFDGPIPNKIMTLVLQMQLGIILDFFHGIFIGERAPDATISILEIFVIVILVILNILCHDKTSLIGYFDKKYVLVWILFTLNVLLFFTVITNLEFSNQMKILISAILILTSAINVYFCYYLEQTRKIFEENLVISKQVEFQENKLEQNKNYLEKNNRLMHDIKKHYLEIEHALSENQMDYVKEYMKGVYQQYFNSVESIFTGNQIIDSMFFSLKDQCEKESINLEYEILINKKITFHDQDLAVLLGSLFDCAVKLASNAKKERTIVVTMKTESKYLLVMIEYPREQLLINTGITKKLMEQWEETQTIHRIVGKNHGIYEIRDDQEKSGVKIIIPLQ